MSELKWNWVYYPYLDAPNEQEESALKAGYIKVVDKSEADKVIADLEESHKKEVTQLLMEIVKLKEKYKELAKLHDKAIQACCDADKVIAHHKYKRCLAMANYCHESAMWLEENGVNKCTVFMLRWEKRWLELAEKFKEDK